MADVSPIFFLTAAEHSGDALGASLIRALRQRMPNAQFVGVGGELMAAAGCRLLANPVQRSAMLVGAFLTQSVYWFKLLKVIRRELAALKPNVVIPIDSSAINLRIARIAKSQSLRVCYLVAPQVWASRPGRIKKIKAHVDTLCCLLPFEEDYFRQRGVKAVYVGHPMFDTSADARESDPAFVQPPLPAGERDSPRIAIFPGSRRAEIAKHAPAMLQICGQIRSRFPQAAFVAVAPSEERAAQLRPLLAPAKFPIDLRIGNGDPVIRWSTFVLAKSGTTTLQIAKFARPMVVLFSVPRWQWAIARHFILTRHIALVNILAGREVVPEFIPFYGNPDPVAKVCLEILSTPEKQVAIREDLEMLTGPLWPGKSPEGGIRLAADRAADRVLELFAKTSDSK